MSDERVSPELRALGAQLFAAGRAERPGPALARRLSMIEPEALERTASRRDGDASTTKQQLAQRFRGASALGAAVLAAAAGVWLWLAAESPSVVMMSPDPARSAAPAPVIERVQEAAASPQAPAAPSEAATVRRSDVIKRADNERVARTRATHARPRALDAAPTPVPSASGVQPSPTQAKPLTLLEELDLLKRARSALRSGDAAHALTLLDRHARERGGNGLGAEAALLRIESLAALGRRAEASELAARFVRENPNSALGDRAKSFITPAPVIKPSLGGHEDAKGVD